MLPEMPSTMLGHERPPRRARPDDPGQPGAGDTRGRSDAARSAAGAYTDCVCDTYAKCVARCLDSLCCPDCYCQSVAFWDALAYAESYTVTDCACSRDTGTVCPAHTGYTASDAGSAAHHPDSDPAT
jgi:hypothetical protein